MKEQLARVGSVFSPSTKKRLLAAFLGSVVVSFLEVLGVLAMTPLMLLVTGSPRVGILGWVADLLGNPSNSTLAFELGAIIFFSFVARSIAGVAFRWWMLGMVSRQETETSVEILRHYMRMPYINHVERGSASLMRTLNEAVSQFYNSVVTGAISAATDAVSIVVIMLGLLVAAPVPSLALIAYFGIVTFVFQRLLKSKLRHLGEQVMELSLANYHATFAAIHGIKEIKLRNSGEHFVRQYRDTRLAINENTRTGSLLSELPKHVLEIFFILGIAITTGVILAGNSASQALGLLAMFVAGGYRILPSAVRVMASLNGVRVGWPSTDIVISEIAQARKIAPKSEALVTHPAPLPFHAAIAVDDLSYRYPTGRADVVSHVNLEIRKGTSVALVGSSGAGKSTLVDLLLGLHDPTGGRILCDGVDVVTDLPGWQANLAMVPQDVYLLDATLRENIAFGEEPGDINDAAVAKAVEQAQLGPLIEELPQGLHSRVGERGGRLSGGQRQRIGIARALYRDPSVLVMDEATSALDNETERKIAATINDLRGSVTLVIVAHRLSTVRGADVLVFMQGGSIAAMGTFDEVYAANTEFANMVDLGALTPPEPVSAD